MVKSPKMNNKCPIEHQRPKMSNFALANLWILDIQFGTLHFEASVYSEHHDAEMVKLVDTLA
ncbi:hypothetical protein Q9Y03_003822 [Vibrio harveyi]|uniref:Uncharacterized protein n=1 Tax=Vibrio harveyi TaxID=669 RepID=A0A2S0SIF4_VIBHA|nr:hypothetical protein BG259_25235 [Vibrio harveyi]AUW38361.1 hypothetical protein AL538_28570 [Vibrio harveyi]AWB02466.1 hypothetical protein CU052_25145 [Vibrio harveyi]ELH4835847.1 hypothetical protein [Vibrio harveyi]MCQ9072813.1 hypothetical protein [Vibrio harveyi]